MWVLCMPHFIRKWQVSLELQIDTSCSVLMRIHRCNRHPQSSMLDVVLNQFLALYERAASVCRHLIEPLYPTGADGIINDVTRF